MWFSETKGKLYFSQNTCSFYLIKECIVILLSVNISKSTTLHIVLHPPARQLATSCLTPHSSTLRTTCCILLHAFVHFFFFFFVLRVAMSLRRPPGPSLQVLLKGEVCSTSLMDAPTGNIPQLAALLPASNSVPPGSAKMSCANQGCNSLLSDASHNPLFVWITCWGCCTKESMCEECERWDSAVIEHAQKYQDMLKVRQAIDTNAKCSGTSSSPLDPSCRSQAVSDN